MLIQIPKIEIDKIAKGHGYTCIDYQEKIGMVSYFDGITRINVYLSTMTVATCMTHPKKGKTQLFRKNVRLNQLSDLFAYPCKHTGKGYYTKAAK